MTRTRNGFGRRWRGTPSCFRSWFPSSPCCLLPFRSSSRTAICRTPFLPDTVRVDTMRVDTMGVVRIRPDTMLIGGKRDG